MTSWVQVLKMDKSETQLLAQHMGHDYNIHLKHYAMQTSLIERSKVAKILSAVACGKVKRPSAPVSIDNMQTADDDVFDADLPGKLFIFKLQFDQ